MELYLQYNDKQYKTDFLINDFSKDEVYYKDLKQADNSAKLTIPYNLDIQNFINAYIDKDIKATIKDGNDYIFTGYLRKNFTFSKKQRNQPLKLELVSPSFLLDVDLPERVVLETSTVGAVVDKVLSLIGITTNTATYLTDSINFFIAEPKDKIKDILSTLLFEYGYCYDFDNQGKFIAYPIFDIPEDFTDPEFNSYIFNGNNCLNEIKVSKKEQKSDNVKIKWNSIQLSNGLIFADTTNGDASAFTCKIELQPHTYLGEGAESYFIKYDSTAGAVIFVKSASLTVESSNNSGLQISFNNLGNKGEVSIYNNTDKVINISKINVNGTFYANTGINETASTLGKKTEEYEAKYLSNKDAVKRLCENYSNYLNYADYTITLKSKTNYHNGNFIKVIEDGLGTICGRIVSKKTNLKNKVIDYTIEAVSEYQKAVANTNEIVNGSVLNTGAQGLSVVAINEYYLTTDRPSGVKADEVISDYPEPMTPIKKYLWKSTQTILSNLDKLPKTEPVIIGVYGDTGKAGADGKDGKDGINGTNGKDGAKGDKGEKGETGAQGLKGDKGDTGANGKDGATGIGIQSVVDYYLATSKPSGVSASEITSTTPQTMTPTNKYLWKTEKIFFTDGSSSNKTTPVIIGAYGETGAKGKDGTNGINGKDGADGNNGKDGKGISSIINYYLATSKPSGVKISEITSTTPQAMTPTNKYLWNYEHINYTDGDKKDTAPAIIGVYGDKGLKGDTGATGANGAKGDRGEKGETGAKGKDGTNGINGKDGAQGFSIIPADTNQRQWGEATWKSLGAVGHQECWISINNVASYRVGDTIVINGIITDRQNINASIYGKVYSIDINNKYVYATSTAVIYGSKGDTGANGKDGVNGKNGSNGTNGKDGAQGATYRGAYSSAPSSPVYMDYYLNTSQGKIYYWSSNQWQPDNNYQSWRYNLAMPDMIKLAGSISNQNVKSAVNTWTKNLVANTALINELSAKKIKLTTGGAIVGGTRYNDSGSLTKPQEKGFYLDSNGIFKGVLTGDNQNVVIGENAGKFLTYGEWGTPSGGKRNVLIGNEAGQFMKDAKGNVLIGSGTSINDNNKDTQYNIVLGTDSFINESQSARMSTNNIVIGVPYESNGGLYTTGLTDASYSILIGCGASNIWVENGRWQTATDVVLIGRDAKPMSIHGKQVNLGNVFRYDGGDDAVYLDGDVYCNNSKKIDLTISEHGTNWMKLSNNLLIQWGRTPGYNGSYRAWFPKSFRDTTYSICATGYTWATCPACVTGKNAQWADIDAAYGIASNEKNSMWIAVGY